MTTTPARQFKLYVLNASHPCSSSLLLSCQVLTPSTQHEKLVLDIDIAQRSIVGYAELTIEPLVATLSQLAFNARQFRVTKVLVSDVPARFTQYNYLEQVVAEEEGIRDLEAWSKAYKAALEASDLGELWIDIPRDVPIEKKAVPKPANPLSLAVSSMDPENGPSVSAAASAPTGFEPLAVKVFYELRDPQGGVYFLLPDAEANPGRAPHMFVSNQVNGARAWFPCLETLTDRCTYTMELTCDANFLVIASGELLEQVFNDDETKKTFYYKLNVPTLAHGISMAVGPFEVLPDPKIAYVTHFCLPGKMKPLINCVSFFHQVVNYLEEYLGVPFPYESYKQVFVEDAYTRIDSRASIAMLSTHFLHGEDIIDQAMITRRAIVQAVAAQWLGNFIGIESWAETWLLYALPGYLANLLMKKMFGNNEHRFHLLRENELVCSLDVGRPPIYWNVWLHPTDLRTKLVKHKGVFVIYMLERKVGAEPLQRAISALVTPPTAAGETLEMNISTRHVINTVRKTTGQEDVKYFEKKWISSKGAPTLLCGFWYSKKRTLTEFAIKQDLTTSPKFTNLPVLVRVNELDVTIDHTVQLDDEYSETDLKASSRNRKTRKKKIRYENGEEVEVELSKRNDTPLLWIRIDPELDFLRTVIFRQPDYMWQHQLDLDRDVLAQYEAVVESERCFYRIRIEAAHSLAKIAKDTALAAMDQLLKFYRSRYLDKEGILAKPNDFSNFIAYHLQKTIPDALSRTIDRDGKTPIDVLELLLQLLKSNDNSMNKYSDYQYLASLIRAMGNTFTSRGSDTEKITKQVTRYINIEKLIPSHHNVITVACLQTHTELVLSKRIPADIPFLKQFTKYGNFERVRITAWSSILRIAGNDSRDVWALMLEFISTDATNIRHKVLVEALLHVPKEGDMLQRDEKIMDALWEILNGPVSAYDCQLRKAAYDLYRKIYGTATPAPARSRVRVGGNEAPAAVPFDKVPMLEKPQAKKPKVPKPAPEPAASDALKASSAGVKLKLSRPAATPLVARAADTGDGANRPLRLKLSRPAVPSEADGSPSIELQFNVPAAPLPPAPVPASPVAPEPAANTTASTTEPTPIQVDAIAAPPPAAAPGPALPPLVLHPPAPQPAPPPSQPASGLKLKLFRRDAAAAAPMPAPVAPTPAASASVSVPAPVVPTAPTPSPAPLPSTVPAAPAPAPTAVSQPAEVSVATPPYAPPQDASHPVASTAPTSSGGHKLSLKRRAKD